MQGHVRPWVSVFGVAPIAHVRVVCLAVNVVRRLGECRSLRKTKAVMAWKSPLQVDPEGEATRHQAYKACVQQHRREDRDWLESKRQSEPATSEPTTCRKSLGNGWVGPKEKVVVLRVAACVTKPCDSISRAISDTLEHAMFIAC
eukprot:1419408-Pleurochrysis_carterae.AAC.1